MYHALKAYKGAGAAATTALAAAAAAAAASATVAAAAAAAAVILYVYLRTASPRHSDRTYPVYKPVTLAAIPVNAGSSAVINLTAGKTSIEL